QREEFLRDARRRFDPALGGYFFTLKLRLLQNAVAREAGNSPVEQARPESVIELFLSRQKSAGRKLALPLKSSDVTRRQLIRIDKITGGDFFFDQSAQCLIEIGVKCEPRLTLGHREERVFLGRLILFC